MIVAWNNIKYISNVKDPVINIDIRTNDKMFIIPSFSATIKRFISLGFFTR